MCYTVITKYVQCSHKIHEFHQCRETATVIIEHLTTGLGAKWSEDEDDEEHEFLKIQRIKPSVCPDCSGKEEIAFRLPPNAFRVELPIILLHGNHLFSEICEHAYYTWTKAEPITTSNTPRTVTRQMVELSIDKVIKDHTMLPDPDPAIVHPLPEEDRWILYPAIARELFFMAANEKAKQDKSEAGERELQDAERLKAEAQVLQQSQALWEEQKEKLAYDIRCKDPFIEDRRLQSIVNCADRRVEGIRDKTPAGEVAKIMRVLAFQEATCYKFSAWLAKQQSIEDIKAHSILGGTRKLRKSNGILPASLHGMIDDKKQQMSPRHPVVKEEAEGDCLSKQIVGLQVNEQKLDAKPQRPKLSLQIPKR